MADDFENVTVPLEIVLGCAHDDLREAMLFCETTQGHPDEARRYEHDALEWALGAALDLCALLGYTDLRARVEAVRDELPAKQRAKG